MNLIGDILLRGRAGRPAGVLEKSPSHSMERTPSGAFSRPYAIAEVLDVDLMDEDVPEVVTTQSGEAFVKDDWGLLIGLAWSLPAGIVVWILAVCFL